MDWLTSLGFSWVFGSIRNPGVYPRVELWRCGGTPPNIDCFRTLPGHKPILAKNYTPYTRVYNIMTLLLLYRPYSSSSAPLLILRRRLLSCMCSYLQVSDLALFCRQSWCEGLSCMMSLQCMMQLLSHMGLLRSRCYSRTPFFIHRQSDKVSL